MRWAAIAGLVLLNVLILGWYLAKPAVVTPPPGPQSVAQGPSLTLLAELPAAERPAPRKPLKPGELPAGVEAPSDDGEADVTEAATKEPLAPRVPSGCFRVGYFPDQRSAKRTGRQLEAAGGEISAPLGERFERRRYWVLLPAAPSRSQALAVIEKVRRAGITDYYLIPSGEKKNVLSLGVFSTREAAQRRLAEIGRLKLKVRVEEVKVPGKRFSLQVRWRKDEAPPWNKLLPAAVSAEPGTCERIN